VVRRKTLEEEEEKQKTSAKVRGFKRMRKNHWARLRGEEPEPEALSLGPGIVAANY